MQDGTEIQAADIASALARWYAGPLQSGLVEISTAMADVTDPVGAGPLLDMPADARVWRAGCSIRSAMLNDMAKALAHDPGRYLILSDFFSNQLRHSPPALRRVAATGAMHGPAVPALGAGLAWFDMMRTERGTANMNQGQRDCFGLHGFEPLDGLARPQGPWAMT